MQFRFTGDDGRMFPHVSLTVEPGDVIDAAENPDPMWFEPVPAPAEQKKSAVADQTSTPEG